MKISLNTHNDGVITINFPLEPWIEYLIEIFWTNKENKKIMQPFVQSGTPDDNSWQQSMVMVTHFGKVQSYSWCNCFEQ